MAIAEKNHKEYRDVKDIYKFYENLAEENQMLRIESIGKSIDGREINLLKINAKNSELPLVFIDAGIHAREWISPAAVMYFVETLLKILRKKTKLARKKVDYLSAFQWHIVPLANPDGYDYSRKKDRMWRKNRRKNQDSDCDGVDLNRNFGKA